MNYDKYMQKALRTVVREILEDISQNGINGRNYYYITFQTNRSDVIMPDFVRARYSEEITIVLQHQFDNLYVDAEKFQVDLAFGGVSTTLVVPFIALKKFVDPSADFGLTLTPEPEQHESKKSTLKTEDKFTTSDHIINLSNWRKE